MCFVERTFKTRKVLLAFKRCFKLAKTVSNHLKQGFPSTDFSDLACHAAMLL